MFCVVGFKFCKERNEGVLLSGVEFVYCFRCGVICIAVHQHTVCNGSVTISVSETEREDGCAKPTHVVEECTQDRK
jgi:hypothetical protein